MTDTDQTDTPKVAALRRRVQEWGRDLAFIESIASGELALTEPRLKRLARITRKIRRRVEARKHAR